MNNDVTRVRSLRRAPIPLVVLLSIPVLLAGIHATISEATRTQLYFSLTDPSWYTAWTAAAVHGSWTHLEANMVAYLLATLTGYAVYTKWERERLMIGIFTVVLITTPPVQSLIDYVVLNIHLNAVGPDAHTKGFSGVVGAFVGMLIASIGGYVTHRTNTTVGNHALLTVFFLASIIVFAAYPPDGHMLVVTAALLLIGFGITTYTVVTELNIRDATGIRNRISQAFDDVVLVYVSTVVALTLVYLSFPADSGAGETTTNIIAHLTGIVYGFLATTTLVRYTE
jgi:membrane associated rhomboid family serine protease